MNEFRSVEDILDFAIAREDKAAKFYETLARLAGTPEKRQLMEAFSREEMLHKQKLMAIKSGKTSWPESQPVQDLKIGDYLVPDEPGPDMNYQQALIIAMKREKSSFKLYTDLAARVKDESFRSTLQLLAMEEAKHKLRFELDYDELVLKEN